MADDLNPTFDTDETVVWANLSTGTLHLGKYLSLRTFCGVSTFDLSPRLGVGAYADCKRCMK